MQSSMERYVHAVDDRHSRRFSVLLADLEHSLGTEMHAIRPMPKRHLASARVQSDEDGAAAVTDNLCGIEG